MARIIGGRYEIIGRIGRGGMSRVYLAMDLKLRMKRAVKEMELPREDRPYLRDAAINELNVLRNICHPNLARIVDLFCGEGLIYIVMEYIEGKPLSELISSGKIKGKYLDGWVMQLSGILKEFHSRRPPVIYRDMKPENIIVRPDMSLCVLDFGTAKRLRKGPGSREADAFSLGTRAYAAPEQFEGSSDERSDIYALGKTVEAMENAAGSRRYRWLVRKCTYTEPEKRYENAAALSDALRRRKRLKTAILLSVLAAFTLILPVFLSASALRRATVQSDEYMKIIEEGRQAAYERDYHTASELFVKAMTQTDPSRPEAYLSLLWLYRIQGRSEEGLDRLDSCLGSSGDTGIGIGITAGSGTGDIYSGIGSNQEVLMQCALTAFYDIPDYPRAEAYLSRIDRRLDPSAGYLYDISSVLTSINTDFTSLLTYLDNFREYIQTREDGRSRVESELCAARIYMTYYEELDRLRGDGYSMSEAVSLSKSACKLIARRKDMELYRIKALDMLRTIYRMLGQKYPGSRQIFYSASIDYSRQLMESEEDVNSRNKRLADMARMYEQIDEFSMADSCYREIEEALCADEFIYISHLRLLCRAGASITELCALKDEAESLFPSLSSNAEFRKIERMIYEKKSEPEKNSRLYTENGNTFSQADSAGLNAEEDTRFNFAPDAGAVAETDPEVPPAAVRDTGTEFHAVADADALSFPAPVYPSALPDDCEGSSE